MGPTAQELTERWGPRKRLPCNRFENDGGTKGGGCHRIAEECHFVHPEDEEWDIFVLAATKTKKCRHFDPVTGDPLNGGSGCRFSARTCHFKHPTEPVLNSAEQKRWETRRLARHPQSPLRSPRPWGKRRRSLSPLDGRRSPYARRGRSRSIERNDSASGTYPRQGSPVSPMRVFERREGRSSSPERRRKHPNRNPSPLLLGPHTLTRRSPHDPVSPVLGTGQRNSSPERRRKHYNRSPSPNFLGPHTLTPRSIEDDSHGPGKYPRKASPLDYIPAHERRKQPDSLSRWFDVHPDEDRKISKRKSSPISPGVRRRKNSRGRSRSSIGVLPTNDAPTAHTVPTLSVGEDKPAYVASQHADEENDTTPEQMVETRANLLAELAVAQLASDEIRDNMIRYNVLNRLLRLGDPSSAKTIAEIVPVWNAAKKRQTEDGKDCDETLNSLLDICAAQGETSSSQTQHRRSSKPPLPTLWPASYREAERAATALEEYEEMERLVHQMGALVEGAFALIGGKGSADKYGIPPPPLPPVFPYADTINRRSRKPFPTVTVLREVDRDTSLRVSRLETSAERVEDLSRGQARDCLDESIEEIIDRRLEPLRAAFGNASSALDMEALPALVQTLKKFELDEREAQDKVQKTSETMTEWVDKLKQVEQRGPHLYTGLEAEETRFRSNQQRLADLRARDAKNSQRLATLELALRAHLACPPCPPPPPVLVAPKPEVLMEIIREPLMDAAVRACTEPPGGSSSSRITKLGDSPAFWKDVWAKVEGSVDVMSAVEERLPEANMPAESRAVAPAAS